MELVEQRRIMTELLAPIGLPARIRSIEDYCDLDDSCLYAENGEREFIVSLHNDVSWGPGIDHFVEPKDEFRSMDRLDVSVPNQLEPHLAAIRNLFVDWFSLNSG